MRRAREPPPVSFVSEIFAGDRYTDDGIRFATKAEALAYGKSRANAAYRATAAIGTDTARREDTRISLPPHAHLSTIEIPAHIKAHTTGRWAETIFRALSSRIANRWKFVSFRGVGKGEWRGVLDLIAIRKDSKQPSADILKRGHLFDIILIQIKGGSARDLLALK
jgi:hypothetical protein